MKFTFSITNNVAEYEALLVGLRLTKKIKAYRVKVFADSQLVVRQVTGEYEVNDPVLKAYNGLVKQLWSKFPLIQLTQIPRKRIQGQTSFPEWILTIQKLQEES